MARGRVYRTGRASLLFLCLVYVHPTSSNAVNIGIVGLMDEMKSIIAEFAVSEINKSMQQNLNISTFTSPNDIFHFGLSLKENDVVALIHGRNSTDRLCSLSTVYKLPLLVVCNQHNSQGLRDNKCGLSLAVSISGYTQATLDLIRLKGYQRVALLHDEEHAPQALQFRLLATVGDISLHFISLDGKSTLTLLWEVKEVLSEIRQIKADVILLYVNDDYWPILLKEESYNADHPFVWIIQEELPQTMTAAGANIVIGFRLPRIENSQSDRLVSHLRNRTQDTEMTINSLKDEYVLVYDSVYLLAQSIANVTEDDKWNGSNLSDVLLMQLKETVVNGISGPMAFDSRGRRDVKELQIINLRGNNFRKVGTWKQTVGAVLQTDLQANNETQAPWQKIEGRHFRIVTLEDHPFVFVKYDKNGRKYYEGYCIDIINELAKMLRFTYDLHLSYDMTYGNWEHGKWTGAMKEVIEKTADMVAAALTKTEERAKAVAFTAFYMQFTDDMLKKKDETDNSLAQFLSPFTAEVWLMLLACIFLFAFSVFFLNYLSHEDAEDETRSSGFANSLWLSFACTLQQGGEELPRSFSGRLLTACFWFGTLIFINTYTANLAAFFTTRSAATHIYNLEDAAKSSYVIGVTRGQALYSFFKSTDYNLYRNIWLKMNARGAFTKTTAEGLKKVREKDKYIHMADGPLLEYVATKKPCDVERIPGMTAQRSLAFALNLQDPARRNFTLAMLRLRQDGFFSALKRRWWNTTECPKQKSHDDPASKRVHLTNLAGVFIVFLFGLCIGFLLLGIEILRIMPQS